MIQKLLLLLTFVANLIFSQEHKFLDYPKFNEADLKKTNSQIEKNAPAEILYNSLSIDLSPSNQYFYQKKYFSKIKIYDKNRSEEWLNLNIPVASGESLNDFEVIVYNYKNNSVERTIINKQDQLKENLVKGLKFYKLAIPNILDGSVIEYHYRIETSNVFNLTYYLQYNIPVIYQEYIFEYPESLTYTFNSTGNSLAPKYNMSKSLSRLGVNMNMYKFGYENVSSVQKENFVKGSDRDRAKIKPELKKYAAKYFLFESSDKWNKLAEKLKYSDNFGGFLETGVRDIVPEDIKKTIDPLERANKVFDFVKNNYKWNKNFGIIASQSLRQFVKSKSGNSADINLLLTALLKDVKLEANPVLISTVENGVLNVFTPNLNNVNMVLASIKIKDQLYFYDATSFASKVNILPERDWNDFGILLEDDKATDFSFSNTNISKKELFVKADIDVQNSEIKGNISQIETGLYAIEAYDNFDDNHDKYNQAFKTDFAVNAKDIESKLLPDGGFESKMKFSSSNLMDIVGDKIILNPILFLNTRNESFDQKEERKNQIDFISAFTKEKKVELTIPDGYKVTDLPKPKKIVTDDKEISYTYKVEILNNKILVNSKVDVLSQNYPKEYYTFFKQIWKIMNESENQVISLIKN
ncbi:transglutaminase domain-containing protein [Chryseobacterium sp. sg2396]|uniref:transglutaminase domain-containing protein n=1 Tax=Chryseobacterium sp. sg2396 TaxID=3276280 RepID=UPI00366A914F